MHHDSSGFIKCHGMLYGSCSGAAGADGADGAADDADDADDDTSDEVLGSVGSGKS